MKQLEGQMSIFDFVDDPAHMPMMEYLTKKGYKNEYSEKPDHECIVEVVDTHEYPKLHFYEAEYVFSFGQIVQKYPQKCGYECHWWKEIRPKAAAVVCKYSQHTCNKTELWKVADTLDELQCPHVCCRKCNTRNCGARCNGSEEPRANKVIMFGEEWTPLSEKPEGITQYDDLRILGPYKSIYGERWSCCPAYFDGKEVIALNVPIDIPRPEWKYWRLKEKVYPVDIKGICDDAYCPGCDASLDETKYLDCKKCPHCGMRIDWGPWHHFNDEEPDMEI